MSCRHYSPVLVEISVNGQLGLVQVLGSGEAINDYWSSAFTIMKCFISSLPSLNMPTRKA